MVTVTISIPDEMKGFIDEVVDAQQYASTSEFIRALVRQEQAKLELRELLLAGGRSPMTEMTEDSWADLYDRYSGGPAPA